MGAALLKANDYTSIYDRSRLRVPAVGIIDEGGQGDIPATARVRAYRKALAARSQRLLRFERVVAHDYAAGLAGDHLDAILVVRTGPAAVDTEGVLACARSEGVRIVLNLDDDLISDHAISRLKSQVWDPVELHALRDTLSQVDHVITSTSPLAESLASRNPSVNVVPNALDPRLWRRELPAIGDSPRDGDAIRVLYMGSATHADDLAILDGVVERVSDSLRRKVVLDVVGVTSGPAITGMRRVGVSLASRRAPCGRPRSTHTRATSS